MIAQALFVGNYFLVDTYAPEILPTPVRYTYAPEILPTPVRYTYAPEILPTTVRYLLMHLRYYLQLSVIYLYT